MSSNTNSQPELIARIKELESEIKQLKSRKKFGLVWEDKPEDVVLQCVENVPVLKEVKNRKIVKSDTLQDNLLIEGDNYYALSVLNYTHKNKIDVIYIDPPYNTGAKDWKYNNDYVDGNDQWKHSKWISWMNNRLLLAKNLLTKDGVLVCAIDHNEQETLGLLLAEIFPTKNITCVTVIHNPAGIQGDNFSYTHEFLYFVYPTGGRFIGQQIREEEGSEDIRNFRDVTGEDSLRTAGANCFYPILVRDGEIIGFGDVSDKSYHPEMNVKRDDGVIEIYPIDPQNIERKWRFARQTVDEIKSELKVKYIKARDVYDVIRIKNRFNFKTVWFDSKYSANNHGTQFLNQILDKDSFSFPKSIYAVIDSLKAASNENKNITVLDFFAGSGTTGHAVLELNKQDGGNRKFILCTNNENKICEEVTYERIKRVIKGYTNKKGEKVEGLGGNLSYYKTDLVNIEKLHKVSDEARIRVTYQAGEMIAVREDTLNEVEKNDWWQIFDGNGKVTAIYFKENKDKLQELINLLEKKKVLTVLYIFGWGKNEYRNEYSTKNIKIEDIPEPILEVYKEINRL
jgi:adenine-specific DNA-methyltransferase